MTGLDKTPLRHSCAAQGKTTAEAEVFRKLRDQTIARLVQALVSVDRNNS